jgi:hypothetical protein
MHFCSTALYNVILHYNGLISAEKKACDLLVLI